MATKSSRQSAAASAGVLAAIERTMPVIEFSPDGTIIRANDHFLQAVGYSLGEIQGRHHSLFLNTEDAAKPEYKAFWKSLASGVAQSGRFPRVAKGGRTIWLEASYTPVLDDRGKTVSVIKVAHDITEQVESARITELALEKAREAERIREELDRTLQEMSTPVMPIWDAILMLPLVGVVDSARTDDVMRKSLERISETRSKMFILDISGVPAVDTAVANQLLKITKATQLMGCETIISGLSPAIARTMVDLGVDVGEVRTTATLRDAFAISLRQVGSQAASPTAA